MEFTIENEYLKVTVTSFGAQLKSVVRKSDNVEHMWQADPDVWGCHAPILFPYTGRLKDARMVAKGKTYENSPLHGFAQHLEHALVVKNKDTLVLQVTDTPETLAIWPWKFRLLSSFVLDEDVLHHTLTVENRDEEEMPFGIGYHPGFAFPFDDKHTYEDYELRFDKVESPICMDTAPRGLLSGGTYYLGKNITAIPLDDQLFANDSHCMVGLQSDTLGIYEKDTGRGVVCAIKAFPYCLIWSKPGEPKFVCIEPWNSLPSPENGGLAWNEKPAAAVIAPTESWSTTLSTAFVR
jgi:aldose 1-epimerase